MLICYFLMGKKQEELYSFALIHNSYLQYQASGPDMIRIFG